MRFWLVALFVIASVMAVIWLGRSNLTQSRNPATAVPASLESTEAVLQIGQSMLDFELADLDGDTVRFSSLSGRPVVINFWATWCAPCRAEMPLLQAFYEEHKQSGVVVLGIDAGEPVGTVRQFLDEEGITYPVWLDPPGSEPPENATLSLFTALGESGFQRPILWMPPVVSPRCTWARSIAPHSKQKRAVCLEAAPTIPRPVKPTESTNNG